MTQGWIIFCIIVLVVLVYFAGFVDGIRYANDEDYEDLDYHGDEDDMRFM